LQTRAQKTARITVARDEASIHKKSRRIVRVRAILPVMFRGDDEMAKSHLKNAAKKIGAAIGKADRTAHKVAKAGVLAKSELDDISKQVDALKKQLVKTTKKLKKALA
jgi:hypothetical protein